MTWGFRANRRVGKHELVSVERSFRGSVLKSKAVAEGCLTIILLRSVCCGITSDRTYNLSDRQNRTMMNMTPSQIAPNLKHRLQPRYCPTGSPSKEARGEPFTVVT